MNKIQIEHLKELAKKATPGPWFSHEDGTVYHICLCDMPEDICVPECSDDTTYIASISPDILLSIISDFENLLSMNAHMERELAIAAQRLCNCCHEEGFCPVNGADDCPGGPCRKMEQKKWRQILRLQAAYELKSSNKI